MQPNTYYAQHREDCLARAAAYRLQHRDAIRAKRRSVRVQPSGIQLAVSGYVRLVTDDGGQVFALVPLPAVQEAPSEVV